MKSIRIAIAGLAVCLVASLASADGWSVSVHAGGAHPPGAPIGGYAPWAHHPWVPGFPAWGPTYYPGVTNGGWNVGWSQGYAIGGYWFNGWRQPIYFVYPWSYYAGTFLYFGDGGLLAGDVAGAAGGGDADPAPVPGAPGHGVFMVPVSAPPVPPKAQLEGVQTPMPKPSTSAEAGDSAAVDKPRRNFDAISKIFRSGDVARAETELAKLIRANPSDAEVAVNYAYVLFLRDKYATAAYCLRRAFVLDPKTASAGSSAIASFHDSKASDAALERLDKFLETNPKDAGVRLLRAWALYVEVRFIDSRAELAKLLDQSPDDAQAAVLRDVLGPSVVPAVK